MMTLQKTVDIPTDRRLRFDWQLPQAMTRGASRVEITVTPIAEKVEKPENLYKAIDELEGFALKIGSKLTVDRFLEMRREETEREEAEYRRLFHHEGE